MYLYDVNWTTGELETYLVKREDFAPGATVSTYVVRNPDGFTSRISKDMYVQSPKEAYERYMAMLAKRLADSFKQTEEMTKVQGDCLEAMNKATKKLLAGYYHLPT